jgi:transcriptional regulator with XRE-family HTH domain
MRLDVFDANAERLGATTDAAKAELIGVDRVTLWRYRTGRLTPSLDRAYAIARTLGITVDDLIERPAA